MEPTLQISDAFINENTNFKELIQALKSGFASKDILIPQRHHHDFPNPETGMDSTLLLMPAWNPGQNAGVKMVTISPENSRYDLPAVQGSYILMNAVTGEVRAILEAKELTAKRTAATSALASSFLSKPNASTLLMIGTGALSSNLIRAHSSVRPIKNVFVWGRNLNKAKSVCYALKDETFSCEAISSIEEKVEDVDIISCATLSKTPLILGQSLRSGQHIDLVGAYKKDMREADDDAIRNASVFVDSHGGREESGDIFTPLERGILKEEDIKGDLFDLCSEDTKGRTDDCQITLFKSVGHALEDLVAATYFYNKSTNE